MLSQRSPGYGAKTILFHVQPGFEREALTKRRALVLSNALEHLLAVDSQLFRTRTCTQEPADKAGSACGSRMAPPSL